MSPGRRQQLLLIFTMAALALLVGDRLVFTPYQEAWQERARRMEDLEKSLATGELLIQREEVIRDRWAAMERNTLPEDASAAENELLKAFERWSQDSQMSISAIKPQWRQGEDENYLTLECRAEGFGSLESVARFLYELESDTLPVKLDSVELVSRDPQGRQLTLGMRVSGLILKKSGS